MGISFSGNPIYPQPFLNRQNGNTANNDPNGKQALKPLSPGIPAKVSACGCGGSHGPDFDHAAVVAGGGNPEAAFQQFKARQYSDIMAHEQAHASAAGSLGGGIHIQYDGNGVAVSGHVPIAIPGMDRQNPEISYKNYSTVRGAALAPGDPSGQDCAVASMAQSLMGQAQVLISQKKQAQSAGLSVDDFHKLGGTPAAVDKAGQGHTSS